jgi:hypothetical protein
MGALTSKPFSFTARSWELSDRITYDYSDTFFSAIKVNFRGNNIIRILPEILSNSLSEWISDRTRFSYDSVNSSNRVQDTFFQLKISNLSSFSLSFFFKRFPIFSFNFNYFDLSAAIRIKNCKFFNGSSFFSNFTYDFRDSFYVDFLNLSNSFSNYRSFFLVGLNLRYTLPVFSVSLRKKQNSFSLFIFNLGFFTNNLLSEFNIGTCKRDLINFFNFNSRLSKFFSKNISSSVIFTNPNLNDFVTNKFYFFNKIYSFFSRPSSLSFSEINFCISLDSKSIKLFLPHPFKVVSYNLRSSSYQKVDSLFSTIYYGNTIYFFGKRIITNSFFINLPFNYFIKSFFNYSNFYTHFFNVPYSKNSLNLLVAVKRQIDNRSSFNYYI